MNGFVVEYPVVSERLWDIVVVVMNKMRIGLRQIL